MRNTSDYPFIIHEIKNMIAVIGSSLQLMEAQHPTVQEFTYWKETMSEVKNLRQMVQQASGINAPIALEITDVSLPDFLEGLKAAAEALFPAHAQISLAIDPAISYGYFDSLRIRQALINLIKNASEAACEDARLSIRLYRRENILIFEVSDNGSGLPVKTADALFAPYFTTKPNGCGLGLSIVRQIVEAHKGSITITDTPGWNTTFVIALPDAVSQTEKSDLMCEVS